MTPNWPDSTTFPLANNGQGTGWRDQRVVVTGAQGPQINAD